MKQPVLGDKRNCSRRMQRRLHVYSIELVFWQQICQLLELKNVVLSLLSDGFQKGQRDERCTVRCEIKIHDDCTVQINL